MATNTFEYVNLSDDLEHYYKAFAAFIERRYPQNAREAWVELLLQHDNIKTCISKLERSGEPLRVLGIGSGTGEEDCKLIASLLGMYPKVQSTVVEPSVDHLRRYQERVESTDDLRNGAWDWRQHSWEEYSAIRKSEGDSTKFHIITSIHSSYYFLDHLEATIGEIVDCLQEDGLLLMVHCKEESGSFRAFNWQGNSHNDGYSVTTGDIRKMLERRGLVCNEAVLSESSDVTDCFAREIDNDARLLVDFMTHVVNFQETAPPSVYNDFVRRLGSSEMTFRENGRIYMDVSSIIIISKKK